MKILLALTALLLAASANAAPRVLDPGPGGDYLGVWCGGQKVNEWGMGFDANGNVVTRVRVTTTCHGSGRGAPNIYYQTCETVTFMPNGAILSKTDRVYSSGRHITSCAADVDAAAVYTRRDAAGNVLATLSTTLGATGYRAVLEIVDPQTLDTTPPTTAGNQVAMSNRPNPFGLGTTVEYRLPASAGVRLTVLDLSEPRGRTDAGGTARHVLGRVERCGSHGGIRNLLHRVITRREGGRDPAGDGHPVAAEPRPARGRRSRASTGRFPRRAGPGAAAPGSRGRWRPRRPAGSPP